VGFAHVAPSRDDDAEEDVGELTAIYVLPDVWGHGGGRLLIERALESLGSAGFAEATLWVLDTNGRARRFYEAAEWHPDGASKVDDRQSFRMTDVRYRRMVRPSPTHPG
jgi:GNAT superfamily N-acetyltransferase